MTPKNILLIGPTGVGKTEIARRLAKLVGAPFVKVEATKYTEVGYYGRDVEGLVRDLVEAAIVLVAMPSVRRSPSRPRAGRAAFARPVLPALPDGLARSRHAPGRRGRRTPQRSRKR